MERWAPEPARPRRRAGQPSFSSSLLDAICDSMDEQPGGVGTTAVNTATERDAAEAKKQREAALHWYYYYKPSLAASHRAARAAPAPGASGDDCTGRGYFSSSEVEYSLRRLRPIRTSGGGGVAAAPPLEKQQQPATEKARRARKPAAASARGCRRPASPGARIASLLSAIFSGKRHSARQHLAPAEEELACSTAPSSTMPCHAKTPPSARARARASRSRSRTVRFLDIDGEVAVAAAAAGCRQVPVVEVEVKEVLLRPAKVKVGRDSDGGEESSDASSDLFELENLAAIAPVNGGGCRGGACGDELPVYGTTGVGLRHDIGRRRPFGYGSLGQSYRRVV
ncbi:protein BIG GRAIN 1-like [Phragmites australis]|uniref:protein BIG GRAIN 1-like n=1 Tax=Phragmites australis TaxID=29695 RepID=UPI002D7888F1|nr:protein BIG GRAIN 1-like [Phragmites australis]